MKKKRVVFFGDSNTYGFDPADYYEARYPYGKRWTTMVAKALGEEWEIVPEGLNGRRIPSSPDRVVPYLLDTVGEEGYLAVMLGTNDVAHSMRPTPQEGIEAMAHFLSYLAAKMPPSHLLLIAPPYVCTQEDGFAYACHVMNTAFAGQARAMGAHFVDAEDWGIDLAYDQVHFSEAGHATFARRLSALLPKIWTE